MRQIALVIISFIALQVHATSLTEVRKLYVQAANSEEVHAQLYEQLKNIGPDQPVLYGYRAAIHMMSAEYTYNPYSKYRYFKEGKEMIESVINSNPASLELRFLRLSIQLNVPDILDYSDNIETDRSIILKGYSTISDKELKQRIREVLLHYKLCSAAELK